MEGALLGVMHSSERTSDRKSQQRYLAIKAISKKKYNIASSFVKVFSMQYAEPVLYCNSNRCFLQEYFAGN